MFIWIHLLLRQPFSRLLVTQKRNICFINWSVLGNEWGFCSYILGFDLTRVKNPRFFWSFSPVGEKIRDLFQTKIMIVCFVTKKCYLKLFYGNFHSLKMPPEKCFSNSFSRLLASRLIRQLLAMEKKSLYFGSLHSHLH